MKTLDRYIAGTFIKNLLSAILAMTVLFVLQAYVGDLLDKDYTARNQLIFHLYGLPQKFVQLLPPSLLLATVMTLSSFNRTQELRSYRFLKVMPQSNRRRIKV